MPPTLDFIRIKPFTEDWTSCPLLQAYWGFHNANPVHDKLLWWQHAWVMETLTANPHLSMDRFIQREGLCINPTATMATSCLVPTTGRELFGFSVTVICDFTHTHTHTGVWRGKPFSTAQPSHIHDYNHWNPRVSPMQRQQMYFSVYVSMWTDSFSAGLYYITVPFSLMVPFILTLKECS